MTAYLYLFPRFMVGLAVATALLAAWRYRRLGAAPRRLAWFMGFEAAMELAGMLLRQLAGFNLFLFPVVLLGELALLGLAFGAAMPSAAFRRGLGWGLGLYGGALLLEVAASGGQVSFYPVAQVLAHLAQLALAGLYFRWLLNRLHVERLARDPLVWVAGGLVAYALGNLLVALFSNYVLHHYSRQLQQLVFWGIRNLFNFVLYACLFVALWIAPPKSSL